MNAFTLIFNMIKEKFGAKSQSNLAQLTVFQLKWNTLDNDDFTQAKF
jgi:hypothetical protein